MERDLKFSQLFIQVFIILCFLCERVWSFNNIQSGTTINKVNVQWLSNTGKLVLNSTLGVSLPDVVQGTPCSTNATTDLCLEYGDFAKVTRVFSLDDEEDNGLNCSRIEWTSAYATRLEDCFDLSLEDSHWYGGGTLYNQTWPLEKVTREESPFITGDYTSTSTNSLYGGIIENYFLISTGVAIHIDENIPLFVRWNAPERQMCLISKDQYPYKKRKELTLRYEVCVGNNIREAHMKTFKRYYKKPSGLPNESMILKAFWSTWNEFNAAVNQTIVLAHAQRILSEGFTNNSHFEIDDGWEISYGMNEFNPEKFPDPKEMVRALKSMGFRVTLWTHPFINFDSKVFPEAFERGFLLRDPKGLPALISWWHGDAGAIDFTNPEAVEWWTGRLERLRSEIGIDSFKFDAGEIDRMPYRFSLNSTITSSEFEPNFYTKAYVQAVSSFGGMIEVRTGRGNQDLGIFYRMLDKGSRWGYDNGLQSLIPSLLQFGILGYVYVLPDMIGGNNYKPSAELYIRWMQANTFMPAVQFSIVPWGYDDDDDEKLVSTVTKEMLALREQNKNRILKAVNQSRDDGTPLNRPMWFVDPTDPNTFTINDQYMLGEDLFVAPVVKEGAISRNIYLPNGEWLSSDGEIFLGPKLIENYSADLKKLPHFFKQ